MVELEDQLDAEKILPVDFLKAATQGLAVDLGLTAPKTKPEEDGEGGNKENVEPPPAAAAALGMCDMCVVAKVNAALVPCGHAKFCTNCSGLLVTCPTCTKAVISTNKISF